MDIVMLVAVCRGAIGLRMMEESRVEPKDFLSK